MLKARLHTDGGSRGNPGNAGMGFVLCDNEARLIAEGGWFLGTATNNVAEYSALVWGLQNAREAKVCHLEVFSDSELMVKQLKGLYKVKSEDLKPLYLQAKSLLSYFKTVQITHVYREQNKEADALANCSMDQKSSTGSFLLDWQAEGQDLFSLVHSQPVQNNLPKKLRFEKEVDHMEKNKPYEGSHKLSGDAFEHTGGYFEMTIKDHFDASHALSEYDGPCRYLHGHTWEVEACVGGTELDSVGILYDFKALKTDLHELLENFDHRHINDSAPFNTINPTAENLARVLYHELKKTLPSHIMLREIAVWESPKAKVSYRL